MGREKTIEMIRAKKEVARVPTRKGRAPNSLLTGSHVVLARNSHTEIPNGWKGGKR